MIEPHPTAHALVLSFDEGALSRLRERKARVAVAKRASRGGWTVVWAAWEPSGNDEIAWTERYGVFAGHTLSHDKAPIGVLACVYPAADRALYTFHGETFGPPQVEPDLARGGFDVRNASDKSASFGLVQFLTVNGESRLSATSAIEMAPMVPASL
ncbi:MAG: hypothetical protein JO225_08500, partial [Candidatus Eremiobacteraeota bacterium]|nr:hypothetical protein [Candidatus Eremiobacteraeota bacterium]